MKVGFFSRWRINSAAKKAVKHMTAGFPHPLDKATIEHNRALWRRHLTSEAQKAEEGIKLRTILERNSPKVNPALLPLELNPKIIQSAQNNNLTEKPRKADAPIREEEYQQMAERRAQIAEKTAATGRQPVGKRAIPKPGAPPNTQK